MKWAIAFVTVTLIAASSLAADEPKPDSSAQERAAFNAAQKRLAEKQAAAKAAATQATRGELEKLRAEVAALRRENAELRARVEAASIQHEPSPSVPGAAKSGEMIIDARWIERVVGKMESTDKPASKVQWDEFSALKARKLLASSLENREIMVAVNASETKITKIPSPDDPKPSWRIQFTVDPIRCRPFGIDTNFFISTTPDIPRWETSISTLASEDLVRASRKWADGTRVWISGVVDQITFLPGEADEPDQFSFSLKRNPSILGYGEKPSIASGRNTEKPATQPHPKGGKSIFDQ